MNLISYLLILLFIFFITVEAKAQYEYEDSVKVFLEPDSLSSEHTNEKFNLIIDNISSDTLLLINEFRLTGLDDDILVFPISDYSPNIIMFTEKDKNYFQGDGYYLTDYREFPRMVVVPPQEKVIIEVYLYSIMEIIKNKNWDFSAYIYMARKKDIDSIVDDYYPDVKFEYLNALMYDKKVQTNGKYLTFFPQTGSPDSTYFKIIERGFYLEYYGFGN